MTRRTLGLHRNQPRLHTLPSYDYTPTLDDAGVLASVGSAGDCYDNAMAESFVDNFKTELVPTASGAVAPTSSWRSSNTWFNQARLHEALGDLPPAEFEAHHHHRADGRRSVVALRALAPPHPSETLTTVLQTN